MRRSFLAFVLVLVASANSFAADEKFSSEAGHFSVAFLGKPVEVSKEIESPAGKLTLFIARMEIKKDQAWMVIYNDYPESPANEKPQTRLERIRDGTKGSGTILEDKEIALGKAPGRGYLLDRGDGFARARIFLSNKRLYQVIVAGKTKEQVSSKAAEEFLDSFKIAE